MKRGRPKKIKPVEVAPVETLNTGTTLEVVEPEVILNAPIAEEVKVVIKPKEYSVPVTKEDYLALHKCLKDSGVNSIGDLEVRASKL